MDGQFIIMACVSFCFFVLASAILFRMTPQDAAISWMVRAFIVIGIGHALYFWSYWGLVGLLWWGTMYTFLTMLFVFCVFSVMEASLTLRILSEIARTGTKGMTHKQLLQRYNRNVIVKRRLARLVYSGDLLYVNGAYKQNKVSHYMIREYFLICLRWIFP